MIKFVYVLRANQTRKGHNKRNKDNGINGGLL